MVVISVTVIYCLFASLMALVGSFFLTWPVMKMADENEQPIWTNTKLTAIALAGLYFIFAPLIAYIVYKPELTDTFVLTLYEELTVEEI
jgi:hypothetical protein